MTGNSADLNFYRYIFVPANSFVTYVGFSSRWVCTDLREACEDGHIGRAPHFNSVTNYLPDP